MQIFMSKTENQQPQRRGGCLRGCLIALAIYFVCSFILGLMMGDMLSPSKVKLEDYSVYKLELSGSLVEQAQEANPFADLMKDVPMYGNQMAEATGLDQILDNIRLAEQDDKHQHAAHGAYAHQRLILIHPCIDSQDAKGERQEHGYSP